MPLSHRAPANRRAYITASSTIAPVARACSQPSSSSRVTFGMSVCSQRMGSADGPGEAVRLVPWMWCDTSHMMGSIVSATVRTGAVAAARGWLGGARSRNSWYAVVIGARASCTSAGAGGAVSVSNISGSGGGEWGKRGATMAAVSGVAAASPIWDVNVCTAFEQFPSLQKAKALVSVWHSA